MRLVLLGLMICSFATAKIAPSFSGEKLGGGKVSLKDQLKPKRALLLSFWASWCIPCLEELNHITAKMKAEPGVALDLLTVNVDTSETASDVRPTLKLHKFDIPVLLDPKHEIFGKYQSAKTLPYSVLIGSDGEIKATFNGYNEGMFTQIKEKIANENNPKG